MGFPPDIITRPRTFGGASGLETGTSLSISVTVKAVLIGGLDDDLIWADTGWMWPSTGATVAGEPGAEVTVNLPVTDLPGWRSRKLGGLIDVSAPDSYSHRYVATITISDGGRPIRQWPTEPFTQPTGDLTPIDHDTSVTATTVQGGVVSIPDTWSPRLDALEAQTLPTWTTLTGKPAVIGAGATQADARTAIGAVGITGTQQAIPALGTNSPSRTDKWRPKLAGVRAGTGYAKLLCIGDSTTYGIGADPGTTSYPAKLAALLNTEMGPATIGLAIPEYGGGTDHDPRWTAGTGWTFPPVNTFGWAVGACYKATSGASGALTFQPGYTADTFDVYYIRNAGMGTFTTSVNGAAGVVTSAVGAVGILKATFTATANAAPTVSITIGTDGDVYIVGVDSYLSTSKTIRVGNAGVANATADKWRTDASTFKSLESVRGYAPDLSVIMLGVNDSVLSGGYSADTYAGYLASIITACQKSGDVLLMSVVPSAPGARDLALQAAYRDKMKALAIAKGCLFVDLMARWGDYAAANAAGFMVDTMHPSPAGYADIARAVADTLELV